MHIIKYGMFRIEYIQYSKRVNKSLIHRFHQKINSVMESIVMKWNFTYPTVGKKIDGDNCFGTT